MRAPGPTFPLALLVCSCLVADAAGQVTIEELLASSDAETPRAWTREQQDAIRALRRLRDPEAPPIAELADGLVAERRDVLDGLLEFLEQREVPGLAADPAQVMSIYQEELILHVLTRAGHGAVHAAIDRREHSDEASRLGMVLAARGAVDGSSDLSGLFRLALPEEQEVLEPDIAETLEQAVVAIAARHSDTVPALSMLVHRLRPDLLPVVVNAVGTIRDPDGIEVLAQVLLRDEALASQVAAQVPRIGASPHLSTNDELSNLLRPHLHAEHRGAQRATVLALGVLEDYSSLPDLIEFLDSEDAGLRTNSAWALRELTGRRFGEQSERWQAWYAEELAWSKLGRRRARLRLESRNIAHAAEAVREYATHRLHRHALAEDLEVVLRRNESSLRIVACHALAELDSLHSMPELVELLDDPRNPVRETAWDTLKRISGQDLPLEPPIWKHLVVSSL